MAVPDFGNATPPEEPSINNPTTPPAHSPPARNAPVTAGADGMGAASCLDSGERSRERTARSQSGALWRCIPQHPAWEPTQRSRSRTPMTAPFDRSPRTAHVLRAHAMSREPTTRSAQRCSLFAGCFPRARALWLLNLWQSSRPTSSFCFFFSFPGYFCSFFSPCRP